ncbi:urea carboxylase [Cellulomonas wangsupingiae]|uniref:Urea carboxylase n=1 Tax=Cellulomonas wangsupingiae TaxID=2968085 RepID=A0ABY5K619_9CELL|nr:urea carboxylase [Cellulomonas wangsupingiae]MCC2334204.1 urea carboxylase [Cellulomonas wangsupingiae]UUI65882.1 urea carboxylase [Cellulomonas wangsupingiae]
MFDTLLVADRGEIAVRVLRTASALGLRTVAVHSDADAAAPHVRIADQAVRIGPAPAVESYLRADAVLAAARATGAGAVHPGYGFLAEDAGFAASVEAAGLVFVGPTPAQLAVFGDKHRARAAARVAGVPLLPGSGLLADLDDALAAAERIGYPVMLKAVGGGGGTGMRVCDDPAGLRTAYARVAALPTARHGVYLERLVRRARHVEVQVFGDGTGRVLSLGDRDCSLQRRHQKVVEEAPAPALPAGLREQLAASARALTAAAGYRSAGTVEYVVDVERGEHAFLEVNARLQVEHTVTEEVTGVDLVAWMLRLARGDADLAAELAALPDTGPPVRGHAVEARVHAEDPRRGHRPDAGLLTSVTFPPGVRVDTWAEAGQEVSTHYDPLLAKVVVHAEDRAGALDAAAAALAGTAVHGVATNLPLLRAAVADADVRAARHTTTTLAGVVDDEPWVEVLRPGVMTTVQDWPGRLGYWHVGICPSGPMDDLSFRLGNTALGNPQGAAGLECTLLGPRLRFSHAAVVCVTGARAPVTVDGTPVPQWEPVDVPAGAVLDVGAPPGPGLRTYVLVRGGLDVPRYLGSAATFTLGGLGGYTGRALAVGDVLVPATVPDDAGPVAAVPAEARPRLTHAWELAVQEGPQAAPTYLTREDLRTLYDATWHVQAHVGRTGIRLAGPRPRWARADGGEAGLHPSNVHDTPYGVGALNLSGDTPILLGPDGPSLGGFACPLAVVAGHRWRLGQIRPGDTVRLVPVAAATADALRASPARRAAARLPADLRTGPDGDDGVLARVPADRDDPAGRPAAVYLRGADDHVLVEYGPPVLDLAVRLRVHALAEALRARAVPGVVDVTPGVRSLHVRVEPDVLPAPDLVDVLVGLDAGLPPADDLVVPSRRVHLPLSFDDPVVAEAVERYAAGVRAGAPWLPSNVELVRRMNGLAGVEDVLATMTAAEYLVIGLGDVYLGAPLAVPLDPRHRLMTTKYNPARTWTAAGSVGLGGQYLCVYALDSPGGYQLVGRTLPVWSGHRQHPPFEPGVPWLLRFFDRIVWHPVGADELEEQRAACAAGRLDVLVEEGTFSAREHRDLLAAQADDIARSRDRQAAALARERRAWALAGELDAPRPAPGAEPVTPGAADGPPPDELPAGHVLVAAPMVGCVWRVAATPGARVRAGDLLVALEAMKLELPVAAPSDARVVRVLVEPGQQVTAGAPLAVLAVGA